MICGLKVFTATMSICSVTLLQHTSEQWHTLWSVQLESVRKDVECTFGILKVRFKILSPPIPYVSHFYDDDVVDCNNH